MIYKNKNYSKAMEPLRDYIIFNPDSSNVLETFADILFQDKHKSTPKYWKSFNVIFKKENFQRKECLMLPVNALMKITNIYD